MIEVRPLSRDPVLLLQKFPLSSKLNWEAGSALTVPRCRSCFSPEPRSLRASKRRWSHAPRHGHPAKGTGTLRQEYQTESQFRPRFASSHPRWGDGSSELYGSACLCCVFRTSFGSTKTAQGLIVDVIMNVEAKYLCESNKTLPGTYDVIRG